ncbi:hypothetical protein SteCoe_6405 [Stentor coeruleus]|uniref:Uncharacterized protein n=1 Tax=Stentor coeruleus TaxID=5963 RepID=A0A1R2CQ67_9CILI|nr:hypothetical protein SteCoe_6405 [Stentor coeruleus]
MQTQVMMTIPEIIESSSPLHKKLRITTKYENSEGKKHEILTAKNSVISVTPLSTRLESHIKYPSGNFSNRSPVNIKDPEMISKRIKKSLENRIFTLKHNFELKKSSQVLRLKDAESERELRNQKLLEKLQKSTASLLEKNTKNCDDHMKKKEKIREFLASKDKIQDDFIKETMKKYESQDEKVKRMKDEELTNRVNKAKSMSRNLVSEKKEIEEKKVENDFMNFVKKRERNSENKKKIISVMVNDMKMRKNRELSKADEVRKKLKENEIKLQKRTETTEKKVFVDTMKALERKQTLTKIKSHHFNQDNEFNDRLSGIHLNHNNYKLKLLKEHMEMTKRIDEFMAIKSPNHKNQMKKKYLEFYESQKSLTYSIEL